MRLLLLAALLNSLAFASARTLHNQLSHYTFGDYVTEFRKTYDSIEEFTTRKQIFESRLSDIRAHNANPAATFKKGVNHLTDRTEEEFRSLLGYDSSITSVRAESRLMKSEAKRNKRIKLPAAVDWRQKGVVTPTKDQGQCGSCWAFATAEVVESQYAIKYGHLYELSEQQIADCSPNPQHCGGTGGCGGGTYEIGFEGIMKAGGLATEWTYPYNSYYGTNFACSLNSTAHKRPPAVAKVSDYVVLPANQEQPILEAVAIVGPLAISVDASSWHSYESGVFSGCPSGSNSTVDINHAVVLVGYGTDAATGRNYWTVRNSWAPSWGEDGYIRILRGDSSCYLDPTPEHGTGCDGGPASITACGPCGLFYDVSYPLIA